MRGQMANLSSSLMVNSIPCKAALPRKVTLSYRRPVTLGTSPALRVAQPLSHSLWIKAYFLVWEQAVSGLWQGHKGHLSQILCSKGNLLGLFCEVGSILPAESKPPPQGRMSQSHFPLRLKLIIFILQTPTLRTTTLPSPVFSSRSLA